MTNLQTTIHDLQRIKRRLLDTEHASTSEPNRRRELKAALDIHYVIKKLDKILQSLVPFKLDNMNDDETPTRSTLLDAIDSIKLDD